MLMMLVYNINKIHRRLNLFNNKITISCSWKMIFDDIWHIINVLDMKKWMDKIQYGRHSKHKNFKKKKIINLWEIDIHLPVVKEITVSSSTAKELTLPLVGTARIVAEPP